jgi:carboxymethylenebutenolidase
VNCGGKLERSLFKAGRAFESHAYPDTGHWFFEDDRADAFEPEASALAWTRTIDFLKQRMG